MSYTNPSKLYTPWGQVSPGLPCIGPCRTNYWDEGVAWRDRPAAYAAHGCSTFTAA